MSARKENRTSFYLLTIFVLLTAGIIFTGVLFYRSYKKQYRTDVENQLKSIADLKVGELVQWRKERLGNGNIFYKNDVFTELVKRYFKDQNDADAKKRILAWMGKVYSAHNYNAVFLLDTQCTKRILLPEKTETPKAAISPNVYNSLKSGKIVFEDFYRNETLQKTFLKVLAPVIDEKNNHQLIAVMELRIDPEVYLYPLINKWPVPSRTSETLLARREGNEAVYLNELKFQKNTALNLRISLEKKEILTVKAMLGEIGVKDGLDHRGQKVIGYVCRVPDSPWFFVARTDKAEVFAPLRENLWLMIVFIIVCILCSSVGIGFIWRNQRMNYYKERLDDLLKIKALSARQETILATVPDIIMEVDNNKIYLWANKAGNEFFGEDVIGKEAAYYFEGEQEVYKEVQPLFDGNEDIIYIESWQRRKDGEKRLLSWWCKVLKDVNGNVTGSLSTARDITERMLAEKELEQHRNHLEQLVIERTIQLTKSENLLAETGRLARVGGWELDLKKNVLSFSEVTKQIHEVDPDYQPTLEVAINFYAPEAIPMISEAVRRAIEEGEPYNVELQLITAKQNRIWVRAIGQAYRENGKVVRIGGVFQDINERKLAEQEIARRAVQLEAAYKELEAFSYSVSHDLRAPLRHISGFVELLMSRFKENLPDKAQHYLNTISDSIAQMGMLIDDLLKFSRTGRMEINKIELDMQMVFDSVLAEVKLANPGREINWIIPALPKVYGDYLLLQTVWTNLIGNAVKFTRNREKVKIEVRVKENKDEYIFSVCDNGVGFDMQYAQKLFGVFQRLHPTAEFEGSGIGLANVRRIISRHGGKTWAEAKPDEGATFYFSLPKN